MKRSFLSFSLLCLLVSPAAAGLVFYSGFNGNGLDHSGFGNDITWVGSQNYVSSLHGQAVSFNNPFNFVPATNYGIIPNSTSIRTLEQSSLTVMMLTKIADTAQQNGRLFGGGGSSSQIAFDYSAQLTAGAYAQIRDINGQTVSIEPQARTNGNLVITNDTWIWSTFVLDREAKILKQYKGSELVASESYSDFGKIDFPALYVGSIAQQTNGYGARLTLLDDLGIWNHALSEGEIEGVIDHGVVPEPCTIFALSLGFAYMVKSSKRK
jgi:hypothetical protein